jgi:hypothetical protein
MKHERPDYFVEAPSVENAVLRRIKGNFRRKMVLNPHFLFEGRESDRMIEPTPVFMRL